MFNFGNFAGFSVSSLSFSAASSFCSWSCFSYFIFCLQLCTSSCCLTLWSSSSTNFESLFWNLYASVTHASISSDHCYTLLSVSPSANFPSSMLPFRIVIVLTIVTIDSLCRSATIRSPLFRISSVRFRRNCRAFNLASISESCFSRDLFHVHIQLYE